MSKRSAPLEPFEPMSRKRNRQWEKQNLSRKAVYRGVNPKLALHIKAIAGKLHTLEGEVARAVIEYALCSYGRGDFDLDPRPKPYQARMTLASDATRRDERRRKPPQALWRVVTTWRGFPPELKKELTALASDDGLNVPVGELITALLRFGLAAYDAGLLTLDAPNPEDLS